MTVDDVRAALHAQCVGGLRVWAKANSLSPSYVSDVINGRTDPGKGILKALNLKRVAKYEAVG